MAKVILKNLEKTYQNKIKVLHGINLEIKDGEFMVFVGPSGCAKSTTLRMIAGLEEITSGEIFIGDTLVNNLPPKDRGIAMVFQNYALYPHMTAYENMAFGLKMAKIPKNIIDERVRSAAEKLEITPLLDRKPKEMSGGQKQRVALGRAIVRKPEVFLFDEPLSNLDAKLRVSMRLKIIQLHKHLKEENQKTTMIYVTHDQVEAMTMGDRICVMNEGRIMQVDTPINIYNHPKNKFVASFIGSPAMNFIEGVITEDNNKFVFKFGKNEKVSFARETYSEIKEYIGKKVVLGIRPENVEIAEDSQGEVFTGSIQIVENMGSEAFIYFKIDKYELKLKVDSLEGIDTGYDRKIKVKFNMESINLFDAETEENILY
ncbi:ABC transporter ATP-binding protein [Fusobacterium sp.]|uniref:ABC transporter ATP-binding protein n=1 Tax=Fusobacterium sp. TaxID=68766 RepID=UPI00396CB4A0